MLAGLGVEWWACFRRSFFGVSMWRSRDCVDGGSFGPSRLGVHPCWNRQGNTTKQTTCLFLCFPGGYVMAKSQKEPRGARGASQDAQNRKTGSDETPPKPSKTHGCLNFVLFGGFPLFRTYRPRGCIEGGSLWPSGLGVHRCWWGLGFGLWMFEF